MPKVKGYEIDEVLDHLGHVQSRLNSLEKGLDNARDGNQRHLFHEGIMEVNRIKADVDELKQMIVLLQNKSIQDEKE